MKRFFLALLCLLVAATTSQATPIIGIYDDPYASLMEGEITPYVSKDIYVFASFSYFEAMSAAEFRIANYLGNAGDECIIVTENWNSNLTIGDPAIGFSIAFITPVPGPIALIGTLNLLLVAPDCLGEEWFTYVTETLDSELLVVVDENFIQRDADGWGYTLYVNPVTPVQGTSWSGLRALY
jgi:hypothetical protein